MEMKEDINRTFSEKGDKDKMRTKGKIRNMDKSIWYTKGWEGYGFGWRTKFLIWQVRQSYRLRLISEEDVKRYVHAAIDAALIRKYGDSLRIEHVELKPK